MPGSFEISIGELILEGFAPSDKYRIGEAVQRELERLIVESTRANEPVTPGTRDAVDAGAFTMHSPRVEIIGAQIAQTVFASLQTQE